MVVSSFRVLLACCSGTELLHHEDTTAPSISDHGMGQINACGDVCFLLLPTMHGVPWSSHLHPVHPCVFPAVVFDSFLGYCLCGSVGTQAAVPAVRHLPCPPHLVLVARAAVNPGAQGTGLMPSLRFHLTRGPLAWHQPTPKTIPRSKTAQRLLIC